MRNTSKVRIKSGVLHFAVSIGLHVALSQHLLGFLFVFFACLFYISAMHLKVSQ